MINEQETKKKEPTPLLKRNIWSSEFDKKISNF